MKPAKLLLFKNARRVLHTSRRDFAHKVLFCALLALIPAVMLASVMDKGGAYVYFSLSELKSGAFTIGTEWAVRNGIPFRESLITINDRVKMAGGRRELVARESGYPARQNGVFVGGGGLMRNIDPPVERYVDANISGIAEFAEAMRQDRKQTYLMLIPTSGAILQHQLPPYAGSVMVNQLGFIEDVYGRVSGAATTIDAYSPLIARQGQYIYYRTEDNLTALGGYYVCAAMLSRMGLGRADLNQFDIDYVNDRFYGDLYDETGYADVTADLISVYRYSIQNRVPHEYLVTHAGDGGTKTYHTLFPEHAVTLGGAPDIFLGGMSAVVDVKTASQYSGKLLIFGDKTALAYMPFLVNNCERVTFIDLSRKQSEFEHVDLMEYDKIIFAYGVESFMHTNNPSRVTALLAQG